MKAPQRITGYRYTNGAHTVKVAMVSDQGGSPSTTQAVCTCGWTGTKFDEYVHWGLHKGKIPWTGPTDSMREGLQHAGYDPAVEAAAANDAVAQNLAAIASFTAESADIVNTLQFFTAVHRGEEIL